MEPYTTLLFEILPSQMHEAIERLASICPAEAPLLDFLSL